VKDASAQKLEGELPIQKLKEFMTWTPQQTASYLKEIGFPESAQQLAIDNFLLGETLPEFKFVEFRNMGFLEGQAKLLTKRFAKGNISKLLFLGYH